MAAAARLEPAGSDGQLHKGENKENERAQEKWQPALDLVSSFDRINSSFRHTSSTIEGYEILFHAKQKNVEILIFLEIFALGRPLRLMWMDTVF